jgi:hypothetical protein
MIVGENQERIGEISQTYKQELIRVVESQEMRVELLMQELEVDNASYPYL